MINSDPTKIITFSTCCCVIIAFNMWNFLLSCHSEATYLICHHPKFFISEFFFAIFLWMFWECLKIDFFLPKVASSVLPPLLCHCVSSVFVWMSPDKFWVIFSVWYNTTLLKNTLCLTHCVSRFHIMFFLQFFQKGFSYLKSPSFFSTAENEFDVFILPKTPIKEAF